MGADIKRRGTKPMVSTLVALVFGALVGATVGIMVGSSMERSSQLDRLVAQEHSTSDLSD